LDLEAQLPIGRIIRLDDVVECRDSSAPNSARVARVPLSFALTIALLAGLIGCSVQKICCFVSIVLLLARPSLSAALSSASRALLMLLLAGPIARLALGRGTIARKVRSISHCTGQSLPEHTTASPPVRCVAVSVCLLNLPARRLSLDPGRPAWRLGLTARAKPRSAAPALRRFSDR
jgi:hypothetical protein